LRKQRTELLTDGPSWKIVCGPTNHAASALRLWDSPGSNTGERAKKAINETLGVSGRGGSCPVVFGGFLLKAGPISVVDRNLINDP